MKKTVIIILIILPIVLLISIAIAGRIRSQFETVFVEKVEFIDEFDSPYEYDDLLVINVGERTPTAIRITPSDADNKKVSYSSNKVSVCTVDENGVLFGVSGGKATITVKTDDGNYTATLQVFVQADKVVGVTLPYTQLELCVGDTFGIKPIVVLPGATDKSVTYTSSDASVCKVDSNGKLTALAEGSATLTVKTNDGGFISTCEIAVVSGTPTLAFNLSNASFITLQSGIYVTTQNVINLNEYLIVNTEKLDKDKLVFQVHSGGKFCTLENGVLTLSEAGVVHIKVYYQGDVALAFQAEFKISLPLK